MRKGCLLLMYVIVKPYHAFSSQIFAHSEPNILITPGYASITRNVAAGENITFFICSLLWTRWLSQIYVKVCRYILRSRGQITHVLLLYVIANS